MTTVSDIRTAVIAIDELIDRAKMIVGGAPYWTYVPEEQYVRLSIQGDEATLVWPESHSGYYDSCHIEEQSKSFPLELLTMNKPEIEFWTAEQKRIYDDNEKIKKEHNAKVFAERQRLNELNTLAAEGEI